MSSEARILIVDDEPQVHRFLVPALQAAGYHPERATTAKEALQWAATRAPDAILLDLGLPDLDGREVLEKLRCFTRAPIIVISAREREAEKIAALDAGADDYVQKPFAPGEFLARLRACLRRSLQQDRAEQPWRGEGVEIDLLDRRLRVNGEDVALSAREFQLLSMLVRNAGRVVTHTQLLTAVWGPAHEHDLPYLRVYVGHLRQKLGPNSAKLLRTEAGIGYRFLDRTPA
jgi:two-component system, OmpR family, KDP operon response regulator KdpE